MPSQSKCLKGCVRNHLNLQKTTTGFVKTQSTSAILIFIEELVFSKAVWVIWRLWGSPILCYRSSASRIRSQFFKFIPTESLNISPSALKLTFIWISIRSFVTLIWEICRLPDLGGIWVESKSSITSTRQFLQLKFSPWHCCHLQMTFTILHRLHPLDIVLGRASCVDLGILDTHLMVQVVQTILREAL